MDTIQPFSTFFFGDTSHFSGIVPYQYGSGSPDRISREIINSIFL